MSETAFRYRASGEGLDEHVRSCARCLAGLGCAAGDDTAEAEYRAWRAWADDDPAAARAYRRRGYRW